MKQLCLLVAVLLLSGSMPITATAAGNIFIIDNENVYEGMDKAYQDGYTPTVSGGTATIVLPLTATTAVAGSMITVTPNLGDVSSSPFVYRNYQRNIPLAENAVNGTETTVSSYLIRFDFPLKSGRANGVYPVPITVQGTSDDHGTIMETFTTYVTITDGINPNAAPGPAPEPEPEPAPRPVHLSIDNQNLYDGMDKSYSQGYSPVIRNGTATIILPVLADGHLSGYTVTATPNLGETSNSPFVYKSYQKDVKLLNNPVNNNARKVSSYYIRFDLTLAQERYNGVYPVAITVQGKTREGSIVAETFTSYVTITNGIDPNATPEQHFVRLSIDNRNVYEDMDKSYSQGYSPVVKNGAATVILPVLCDGTLKGNTVTATPNLGGTSSSPFIYRNYQTDFTLSNHAVNNGSDRIASYYIRFDLALAAERYNGVYPVAVTIQGKTDEGDAVTETFTAYVTVTDGKDPNAEPEIETPSSQPIVIVAEYHISPLPVQAGNEFTAAITLRNTSKTKSVQNMTVTAGCDSPNWTLLNKTNVFYIKQLGRGATLNIEVKYGTDMETPAGNYNIKLAIAYDNPDAQTLSSSGTVPVEIRQQMRVELETPTIPKEVNAGDTIPLSLSVFNLSRGKVFNVRCVLEAPGFIPSGTAFIGNMEAGTAASGDMDVFIGSKAMTEGDGENDHYGLTSGKVTLLYEDEDGRQYSQESEFTSKISAPVRSTSPTSAEEPARAGQWWISLMIGGAAIAGIAAYLILRNKRRGQSYADV